MKTSQRIRFISTAVAAGLLLAPLLIAQETNVVPAPAEAELAAPTNKPALEQTTTPSADATSNAPVAASASEAEPQSKAEQWTRPHQIVLFGQDAELKAGETADVVVVIGGSAKVHGKVRDACVVIGGNLEVDGEVGDATVVIFGDLKVGEGAHIHQDAVAVMGSLSVAQGATIGHDAVSVGGKLDLADSKSVHGEKVNIGMPIGLPKFEWLGKWLKYCFFEMRPLAPQVGWIWMVAGIYFLLYLLIAAVFPRPVQACVDVLTKRPATSFFVGLLIKLFVPVIFLILAATVVGLIAVPFVMAALFCGAIVGKVAILEWLGLQIGKHFGWQKPLIAFLIGSAVITLLYMVPILGLLAYMIFSVWGLGCAVTAAFGSMRRERTDKPAPPSTYPGPTGFAAATQGEPASAQAMYAEVAPVMPAGTASEPSMNQTIPDVNAPQTQPPPAAHPVAPVFSTAVSLPRAGFWERMGAAFLDVIIVIFAATVVGFFAEHVRPPPVIAFGFLITLAYFAGMWAWKGTTIGGIVLKLQVVRHDGGPLTFIVALVRGLAAAFSAVVLFLGFFWIGWDRDKQGWHDKIAGTVVVRLPRSMPLVCI